jgi:GxxExxY protein
MKVEVDPQLDALTQQIIGAAFEVAGALRHGFLESVYRKALIHELNLRGLHSDEEVPFGVHYKGRSVGTYQADLVVENSVIVELKALDGIAPPHVGQVINYLRASGLRVGLLLNFGTPKLQFRRILL